MRGSVRLAAAAALAAFCGSLVGAAPAQPIEVDAGAALADAAGAYRAGPVAERITVSVRRVAGGLAADLAVAPAAAGRASVIRDRAERRAEIVLRLWPPAPGGAGDGAIALELGELHAVFSAGEVTVISERGDEVYYRAGYELPLGADDVHQLLPPLPLPQVDLALPPPGSPALPVSLTPYAPRIVWGGAVVDDLEHPTRVILRGRTTHGAVVLTTHPETGRLIEFACDLAGPDGDGVRPVLIARVEPLPAPAGPAPVIAVEGRRRVESISALAHRPSRAMAGRLVTGLSLRTATGEPWSLTDAFAPRAGERGPDRVALLLVRSAQGDGGEGDVPASVRAAVGALTRLAERSALDGAWGVRWWGALVVEGEGAAGTTPPEALAAAAAEVGLPAGRALWTRPADGTLDRYAPGADAAVLVIGQDRRLVGAVALDGESDPAEAAAEIERLLWPGATPAPETE